MRIGSSRPDYSGHERGLEDMEDYCLAAEVLKRVRDGCEQVYSSAEVKESLGLHD